jgi:Ca-activated chloride channel homolog
MRLIITLFAAALPTLFQPADAEERRPRRQTIRTDVKLVLVPVTVMDRRGAVVNGLTLENFKILDDNALRPIVAFNEQDTACSVGVILDVSGSMRKKLGSLNTAVRTFLNSVNPEDEIFVLGVSTHPETYSDFTGDISRLVATTHVARTGGSTALIDTIYLGLSQLRSGHNPRRALLIISDGMDNHSRYSKTELMRVAMEADAQIYTIALAELPPYKKPIELLEQRHGVSLLDDLAYKTGGLHFTMANSKDVGPAVTIVALALHNEYLLGYQPPDNDRGGKWHNIRVKSNLPNTKVYTRSGYYSR